MAHFAFIGTLLVLLSLFICVKPDSFSPKNFVVARPNAILSGCCMSSATSALLEEYTTAGTMVQQLTIPSCTLFGNSDCCVGGFSFMALSPNRNVACFTCQMYPLVKSRFSLVERYVYNDNVYVCVYRNIDELRIRRNKYMGGGIRSSCINGIVPRRHEWGGYINRYAVGNE